MRRRYSRGWRRSGPGGSRSRSRSRSSRWSCWPANILWNEREDQALLTDFGIAALLETSGKEITKLTEKGKLIGDPRYLSPEQLRDQPVTELADVYGFGLLGYDLLAGQSPYVASSETDWLDAHRHAEPRDLRGMRPEVDRETAELLRRCLEKEPKYRPSAADIVRALSGQWHLREPSLLPGQRLVSSILRRRVPQVVVGTAVACWALATGISTLIENALLPAVSFPLALAFGGAAVATSGVVSWHHGQPGVQKPPLREYVLLAAISVAWILTSILLIL